MGRVGRVGRVGPQGFIRAVRDRQRIGSQGLRENRKKKPQISPLRYPGFPVEVGGVGRHMRLSLKKGAYAVLSSAAWQEIRVRSGRDDNSV
jgi:hypothetical protein